MRLLLLVAAPAFLLCCGCSIFQLPAQVEQLRQTNETWKAELTSTVASLEQETISPAEAEARINAATAAMSEKTSETSTKMAESIATAVADINAVVKALSGKATEEDVMALVDRQVKAGFDALEIPEPEIPPSGAIAKAQEGDYSGLIELALTALAGGSGVHMYRNRKRLQRGEPVGTKSEAKA